jgi:hypothetical protein
LDDRQRPKRARKPLKTKRIRTKHKRNRNVMPIT